MEFVGEDGGEGGEVCFCGDSGRHGWRMMMEMRGFCEGFFSVLVFDGGFWWFLVVFGVVVAGG